MIPNAIEALCNNCYSVLFREKGLGKSLWMFYTGAILSSYFFLVVCGVECMDAEGRLYTVSNLFINEVVHRYFSSTYGLSYQSLSCRLEETRYLIWPII